MCPTNTATQICGIPLPSPSSSTSSESSPPLHLCDATKRTILRHLSTHNITPSNIHARVVNSVRGWAQIVKECHVVAALKTRDARIKELVTEALLEAINDVLDWAQEHRVLVGEVGEEDEFRWDEGMLGRMTGDWDVGEQAEQTLPSATGTGTGSRIETGTGTGTGTGVDDWSSSRLAHIPALIPDLLDQQDSGPGTTRTPPLAGQKTEHDNGDNGTTQQRDNMTQAHLQCLRIAHDEGIPVAERTRMQAAVMRPFDGEREWLRGRVWGFGSGAGG